MKSVRSKIEAARKKVWSSWVEGRPEALVVSIEDARRLNLSIFDYVRWGSKVWVFTPPRDPARPFHLRQHKDEMYAISHLDEAIKDATFKYGIWDRG